MDLLAIPVWRFAALVEHWAWSSFDEKHHGELQRELDRSVDFTWVNLSTEASIVAANPLRWQENKSGESLLSVHKAKG